mmetsp:Transcript_76071/g.126827  ORF Transcript_76071/g.126827 Transcript_76071/m.126827 type:complete len:94 (+) Transcript_76071:842-1123(+)
MPEICRSQCDFGFVAFVPRVFSAAFRYVDRVHCQTTLSNGYHVLFPPSFWLRPLFSPGTAEVTCARNIFRFAQKALQYGCDMQHLQHGPEQDS